MRAHSANETAPASGWPRLRSASGRARPSRGRSPVVDSAPSVAAATHVSTAPALRVVVGCDDAGVEYKRVLGADLAAVTSYQQPDADGTAPDGHG